MYLIVALIKMILLELSSKQRSAISPDSKYGKTVKRANHKNSFYKYTFVYSVFHTC